MSTSYALVGDIGGTNARFALVEPGSMALLHMHTLQCADFATIDQACEAYFQLTGIERVAQACLAMACPVEGETIQMTNNHWHLQRQVFAQQLGVQRLLVVNDFTAMALAMLHVPQQQLRPIPNADGLSDTAANGRVRLVMGPGTGLGVGGLVRSRQGWVPLATEGGHMSFAPTDELDVAIWRLLTAEFGRVSVERLLCGQGLLNLYRALCQIRQSESHCDTPVDISRMALAGDDPIAAETLHRFCRLLGSVAGDQVLTLGARGGVYLCGGILPQVQDFLLASEFRQAFECKGRFRDYLSAVPVWLCLADNPGLLGAAAALDNDEIDG